MVGSAGTALRRQRILIVEDDPLIAVSLESMLSEIGFDVVGTVAQVSAALEVIGREPIEGAILDVSLGSQRVDSIADVLAARACPFVFMTGYDVSELPARHAGRAVLQKPFRLEHLLTALQTELGLQAGGPVSPRARVPIVSSPRAPFRVFRPQAFETTSHHGDG